MSNSRTEYVFYPCLDFDALQSPKQSSVPPTFHAICLFHNNKKIIRVLEYCDDVQWCMTNKEWHREREKAACMCFRYTVRCYFLVYLAIFMCCRQRLSGLTNSEMLGNFVPVQGFLPRHAKDGCRKTPDRGTPKNCRVITSKHFMKFFTKKYDKKKQNSHIFHVLPGRICVFFFFI